MLRYKLTHCHISKKRFKGLRVSACTIVPIGDTYFERQQPATRGHARILPGARRRNAQIGRDGSDRGCPQFLSPARSQLAAASPEAGRAELVANYAWRRIGSLHIGRVPSTSQWPLRSADRSKPCVHPVVRGFLDILLPPRGRRSCDAANGVVGASRKADKQVPPA